MNGLEPLTVAGQLGLPLIDADGMGRAFPELQMIVPHMLGSSAAPSAIVDERVTSLPIHMSNPQSQPVLIINPHILAVHYYPLKQRKHNFNWK